MLYEVITFRKRPWHRVPRPGVFPDRFPCSAGPRVITSYSIHYTKLYELELADLEGKMEEFRDRRTLIEERVELLKDQQKKLAVEIEEDSYNFV